MKPGEARGPLWPTTQSGMATLITDLQLHHRKLWTIGAVTTAAIMLAATLFTVIMNARSTLPAHRPTSDHNTQRPIMTPTAPPTWPCMTGNSSHDIVPPSYCLSSTEGFTGTPMWVDGRLVIPREEVRVTLALAFSSGCSVEQTVECVPQQLNSALASIVQDAAHGPMKGQRVLFVGDSVTRFVYWALVEMLCERRALVGCSTIPSTGSVAVSRCTQFMFSTDIDSQIEYYNHHFGTRPAALLSTRHSDVVYWNSGLWLEAVQGTRRRHSAKVYTDHQRCGSALRLPQRHGKAVLLG